MAALRITQRLMRALWNNCVDHDGRVEADTLMTFSGDTDGAWFLTDFHEGRTIVFAQPARVIDAGCLDVVGVHVVPELPRPTTKAAAHRARCFAFGMILWHRYRLIAPIEDALRRVHGDTIPLREIR